MKAKFYLHPDCIKYDSIESEEAYVDKFASLIKDLAEVIGDENGETEYIFSDELYSAPIFEGKDIYAFASEYLDRDSMTFLYQVLQQLGQSLSFTPEYIERISIYSRDEESCHALIVLNRPYTDASNDKYIQFERYELIYNKHSWLTVRRQILGNHPGAASEFMKRTQTYFPNIVFSSHCEEVIEPYLTVIPRKIVYYLSCINDRLVEFWDNHPNKKSINDVYADFAGQYGMDRAGSQQSTPDKSEKYTFEFTVDNVPKKICCGPHFKITHVDANCNAPAIQKNEKFHARIYFNIDKKRVYVGAIGPHI